MHKHIDKCLQVGDAKTPEQVLQNHMAAPQPQDERATLVEARETIRRLNRRVQQMEKRMRVRDSNLRSVDRSRSAVEQINYLASREPLLARALSARAEGSIEGKHSGDGAEHRGLAAREPEPIPGADWHFCETHRKWRRYSTYLCSMCHAMDCPPEAERAEGSKPDCEHPLRTVYRSGVEECDDCGERLDDLGRPAQGEAEPDLNAPRGPLHRLYNALKAEGRDADAKVIDRAAWAIEELETDIEPLRAERAEGSEPRREHLWRVTAEGSDLLVCARCGVPSGYECPGGAERAEPAGAREAIAREVWAIQEDVYEESTSWEGADDEGRAEAYEVADRLLRVLALATQQEGDQ